MRLINYLVFVLLTLLSFPVLADMECTASFGSWKGVASSIGGACTSLAGTVNQANPAWSYKSTVVKTETSGECSLINSAGAGSATVPISCTKIACPTGRRDTFDWWADRSLPSQVCINKCIYIPPTDTGVGCVGLNEPDPVSGRPPGIESCGKYVSTGGECTQPDPDPKSQPKPPKPPMDPSKCKNASGSDGYCKKPDDQACPTGYKQAMFNGQQICVKDSSNTPNPNDPNTQPNPPDPTPPNPPKSGCEQGAQYCENPPNEKACPSGYYRTFYKGQEICVKNNPDPNNPNPNDPNTNPNANPNPPTNPNPNPDPKPDPNPDTGGNGMGGEFCEKGGKSVCDALKDIKDFLTLEQDLPTDERPEISEHELGNYESNYVSWSAQCPPDQTVHINLMHQSTTLVLSWQPWCMLLSKLRWAIIACAYFAAAFIILGMR